MPEKRSGVSRLSVDQKSVFQLGEIFVGKGEYFLAILFNASVGLLEVLYSLFDIEFFCLHDAQNYLFELQ